MRWTVTSAGKAMRAGRLTPLELLDECLSAIDRYESRVRAWVLVDRERAREDAQRLSEELASGHDRGPLHGIPIGVKDIIDVADLPTAAGFAPWANSIAREDADCVARLREAGAVFVGKTVTTTFAWIDPPVTRNPWHLERTPGGSSSGSAAAVACGMCLAALGTQTGGSLTRPAAYCGVCSFKFAHDQEHLSGVVPLAPSLDHLGVIAGNVGDLALVATALKPDLPPLSSAKSFRKDGPLLYPLAGFFQKLPDRACRSELQRVLKLAKRAKATVGARTTPFGLQGVLAAHRTILATEAARYHARQMDQHPDDYPPNIESLVREGLRIRAVDYCEAYAQFRARFREDVQKHCYGYWVTPAALGPAPDLSTTGDPALNSPWSVSGSPTASIPTGWTSDGLPLGVQLIAASYNEDELLAVAAWLERVVGFERRPLPLDAEGPP